MKVYELGWFFTQDTSGKSVGPEPFGFFEKGRETMPYDSGPYCWHDSYARDRTIARARESRIKIFLNHLNSKAAAFKWVTPPKKRVIPDIFVAYYGHSLVASEVGKDALLKLYPYLEAIHFGNSGNKPYYLLRSTAQESPFDFEKSLFYWYGEDLGWTDDIGNLEKPIEIVKAEYNIGLLKKYPLFETPYLVGNHTVFYATEEALTAIRSLGLLVEFRTDLEWDEFAGEDFCPDRVPRGVAWFQGDIRRFYETKARRKARLSPNPSPDFILEHIGISIGFLQTFFPNLNDDESNQIISFISQFLHTSSRDKLAESNLESLAYLWAEQLHRQYNWSWLEKNGVWYITHPNHEDINPIELITDVLEKRMTAVQLSALFNTLGLTS
jgi:hypothetical protein